MMIKYLNHLYKEENEAIYSKSERNTQKSISMVLHHRQMKVATVFLPSICKLEKMALECGEQFPQVHSLATVSIIDSQSCHKTGHSLCLSLWGDPLGTSQANFNHKSLKDTTSQWTVPRPKRRASNSNTVTDV